LPIFRFGIARARAHGDLRDQRVEPARDLNASGASECAGITATAPLLARPLPGRAPLLAAPFVREVFSPGSGLLGRVLPPGRLGGNAPGGAGRSAADDSDELLDERVGPLDRPHQPDR